MKSLCILLAIIFALTSHSTVGQKYDFKVVKMNFEQYDFKNILILGSGDIDTRFFLETFSEIIGRKVKSKQIKFDFKYSGKEEVNIDSSFNNETVKNYDAILLFKPIDTGQVDISYVILAAYLEAFFKPYFTARNNITGYSQAFTLQVISPQNLSNIIWEGLLGVQLDIRKQSKYSKFVDVILENFKSNNLIK